MTGKDPWQLVHELRTQLAACQAHNVELREALQFIADGNVRAHIGNAESCSHGRYGYEGCDECATRYAKHTLSRTTDTEALDAAIAKAVEECAKSCDDLVDEKYEAMAKEKTYEATTKEDELQRLRNWECVRLVNCAIKSCIKAIRARGKL